MKTSSPKYFIDLLTLDEITVLYKHFSGVVTIKFKDRENAELRLINYVVGKLRPQIIQALKDCNIPQEKIIQYGEGMRMPILAPHGPMKPDEFKKHEKTLKADRKNNPALTKIKDSALNDAQAKVLIELRKMIPTEATGEAASVSSTVVAERVGTNVNAICLIAERLEKKKLVTTEDDSNEKHKFLWISLTAEGRTQEVQEPEQVNFPAPRPGPNSRTNGKFIFRLVPSNPRREGTHGNKSFALIKDNMTVEEYLHAGGRRNDLAWDLDHGYVELRDAPTLTSLSAESKTQIKPPKAAKVAKVAKANGKVVSKKKKKAKGKGKKSTLPPPSEPKAKAAAASA